MVILMLGVLVLLIDWFKLSVSLKLPEASNNDFIPWRKAPDMAT